MAQTTDVSTGYNPRPFQRMVHRRLKRFNLLVCHRRFGKTILVINEAIDLCLTSKKERVRVAFIAPFLKQAKQTAWSELRKYVSGIPKMRISESELYCEFPNGARITLYGADNPDAMRGLYLDLAIFDEFAQQSPRILSEVVRPALADRKGGIIIIGTPQGHGALYQMYNMARKNDGWYVAKYKASETGVLPAEEIEAMKELMTDEEIEQELECSFDANISGAIYGTYMRKADDEGRVTTVHAEPQLDTYVAFDLGVSDAMAVWACQMIGNEIRLIGYHEYVNSGLADVLHEVRKLYDPIEVFMPWDIEHRELISGRSRLELVINMGFDYTIAPKLKVADGINASRMILPRCVFDENKCERGIECLRMYRYNVDDKTGALSTNPRHDEFSHGADGFRTLAVCYDEIRHGRSFGAFGSPKRRKRADGWGGYDPDDSLPNDFTGII